MDYMHEIGMCSNEEYKSFNEFLDAVIKMLNMLDKQDNIYKQNKSNSTHERRTWYFSCLDYAFQRIMLFSPL